MLPPSIKHHIPHSCKLYLVTSSLFHLSMMQDAIDILQAGKAQDHDKLVAKYLSHMRDTQKHLCGLACSMWPYVRAHLDLQHHCTHSEVWRFHQSHQLCMLCKGWFLWMETVLRALNVLKEKLSREQISTSAVWCIAMLVGATFVFSLCRRGMRLPTMRAGYCMDLRRLCRYRRKEWLVVFQTLSSRCRLSCSDISSDFTLLLHSVEAFGEAYVMGKLFVDVPLSVCSYGCQKECGG